MFLCGNPLEPLLAVTIAKFFIVISVFLFFVLSDAELSQNLADRPLEAVFTENSIIYLGTHDNNTFLVYLNCLNKQDKEKLCILLNVEKKNDLHIHFECMKQMMKNKSKMAIFQIQDLLLEGSEKRMNVPGRAESCWEYKVPKNYKKIFKHTLKKIR